MFRKHDDEEHHLYLFLLFVVLIYSEILIIPYHLLRVIYALFRILVNSIRSFEILKKGAILRR